MHEIVASLTFHATTNCMNSMATCPFVLAYFLWDVREGGQNTSQPRSWGATDPKQGLFTNLTFTKSGFDCNSSAGDYLTIC